jgi:hypothetical protein
LHYSEEDKARILAQYPEHERDIRTKGVPAMGSGRAFLVDEAKLLVDHFEYPSHWVQIAGCDFGWDHPAAFVECWWDRDLDIFYVVRTFRFRHMTPHQHVERLRHWKMPFAWPADGGRQTLEGAGEPLATQYRKAGLNMLWEHATFEDGGVSVEAGLAEMHDRMAGGRWKIFKGQNNEWLEEYRLYHRKDGLLVKENDDALSASRYALMMKRSGKTAAAYSRFRRPLEYPKIGIA